MPAKPPSIFELMNEEEEAVSEEEEKKARRQELLALTGVKDIFKDGKTTINKFTCVGAQCRLCINVCPTNALYWSGGEVGIIDDLCVYCGACVTNCMVDNCIKIERARDSGKTEKFGKVYDIVKNTERLNAKKRFDRVKANAVIQRRLYREKRNVRLSM